MEDQIQRALIAEVAVIDKDQADSPSPPKPVDNPTLSFSNPVYKYLETIQGLQVEYRRN